ncbi:hypothetical protein, partial [Mesorhizobium sp. M3A.F.Ca.ET.175.01.1.1]|uniref:hypothetical protein n=1 Tax=Mesorhizobium sp. M3A.F.Ca.ET.175.01.1.1 TaxID=2563945 RepID=UPI001AEE413F
CVGRARASLPSGQKKSGQEQAISRSRGEATTKIDAQTDGLFPLADGRVADCTAQAIPFGWVPGDADPVRQQGS